MILGLIPNFLPYYEVNACDTQGLSRQIKGEASKSVAKQGANSSFLCHLWYVLFFFQPNIAGSVTATLNKLEQVDEPGSGKHVEYLFLQTFDIKVAMVGCALLIDSHQ